MKILVICQYYYPEPFRITDICEELEKRGNEVTVVTGLPNYPEGIIYKGYENGEHRVEIINGVQVYRVNTIPRKTGALYRFLNYYSYANSSTKFVKKLPDDFDVVFINQLSPVMMANAGIKYAKQHHKPCVLYCLDLWPVNLVAGGIKRDSVIYNHYRRVSKKIYTAVDKILVTSKLFSDYFKNEFGIDKAKTGYLPQYAEEIFSDIPPKEPSDFCNLVFAGNIGKAQSVITIVKAAEILKDEPVHFHIVGSGIELDNLKAYADEHNLANVTFYGRRPLEEMPSFYAMADAMLLTLEADPVISMTLPGKLQSYMAAGKPVIAAIDGEARRVIEMSDCGYCCSPEDEKALANIIMLFRKGRFVNSFSRNAKRFYIEFFSKEAFFDKLQMGFSILCDNNSLNNKGKRKNGKT